ncbi:MAG: DMT family transporter [Erythrobacter sp.]|uniref:DMT family transporter n=1 Tax=Erythrobacter sp. HL-111 TaxID=1798193 RepID=UPI0006DA567E|nr:DMT family transporter [Erythrobacter sp. HL-111]KPP94312.1 MAG: S-adenosylmethionine uptake transporter [Erythrobacteraceae bacterium HL-111]SDS49952.1 S-adenosylmethionine uptake transporter [Erythrobacter sp. HL-111]
MPDAIPPPRRLAPYAAAFAGVGFLALMDAFMKGAALATGAYTATVLRSLIGAALIAPFWLARGPAWPRGALLRLHLERGIVSAVMALSFFFALTRLPLAEAIALSFVAPLLALYLASILLGETVRREAIAASLLGLAGTLVIVGGRIGEGEMGREAAEGLAALAFSAVLYAYTFVVIRRQSQLAGPVEIATFHSGIGGLFLLAFAPFAWEMPRIEVMGGLAAAGALTVAASLAIAWAYAREEAQALVPIEYSGFLWASLFGWLFFREELALPTLAGAALIVAGCWLVTRRAPETPGAGAAGDPTGI